MFRPVADMDHMAIQPPLLYYARLLSRRLIRIISENNERKTDYEDQDRDLKRKTELIYLHM